MADEVVDTTHWDGPGLDAWNAWTPLEIAERLGEVDEPWCVVGGWSIDLFLGEQTRAHEDLEIATVRDGVAAIRSALRDFEFFSVGSGQVIRLSRDERPPADHHQNWVLDTEAQEWRVDVMLEPGGAGTWIFRRDPSITAERSSMIGRTSDGIPYLAPHGALLYKAKAEPRPKDEADFAVSLRRLAPDSREWLIGAITRVQPDHPWITRLRQADSES